MGRPSCCTAETAGSGNVRRRTGLTDDANGYGNGKTDRTRGSGHGWDSSSSGGLELQLEGRRKTDADPPGVPLGQPAAAEAQVREGREAARGERRSGFRGRPDVGEGELPQRF